MNKEYNIVVLYPEDDNFKEICDYVEKNINRENLYENGETLKYSDLTYDSDFLIIALEENKPVGYNSVVYTRNGYYIYQIAVKKEYKQQGIGTLMLGKSIEMARDNNKDVFAHVMDYNDGSLKMFGNYGFEIIETSNHNNLLHLKQKTDSVKK